MPQHVVQRELQDVPVVYGRVGSPALEPAVPRVGDSNGTLSVAHPRAAKTVKGRLSRRDAKYFAGLSGEETATALEVSPRTVKSDWTLTRAWLYQTLHEIEGS